MVDAERFGNKLLVHNYGHGGGGVTLSWGTATLAVDLARDFLIAHKSAETDAIRRARLRRERALNCAPVATSFPEWTRHGNDLRERFAAGHDVEHRRRFVVADFCLRNDATRKFNEQFRQACRDFEQRVSVARRR